MNNEEMRQIAFAVSAAKTKIGQADLKDVCDNLEVISNQSKDLITRALAQLKTHNYVSPKAFNDGINDGTEAGQVTPHLHWHILPRWDKSENENIVDRITNKSGTL